MIIQVRLLNTFLGPQKYYLRSTESNSLYKTLTARTDYLANQGINVGLSIEKTSGKSALDPHRQNATKSTTSVTTPRRCRTRRRRKRRREKNISGVFAVSLEHVVTFRRKGRTRNHTRAPRPVTAVHTARRRPV